MTNRRLATRLPRGLRSAVALVALAAAMLPATALRADDRAAMVTPPARDAILAMGRTLSAGQFSFRNRTIREYADESGQPLHIFHETTVVVRRPDHLRADVSGDDGKTTIAYDGANLTVYGVELNKYVTIPVSGDLEQMLKTAESRLGLDFPLADFVTNAPDKAFLGGITSGAEINTVSVGGTPCSHLLFMQPPGIELELWVEKGDRPVPRRLMVTYRSLPGEPRFVAEMSDWNFAVQPSADQFQVQVPQGAERVSVPKEDAK